MNIQFTKIPNELNNAFFFYKITSCTFNTYSIIKKNIMKKCLPLLLILVGIVVSTGIKAQNFTLTRTIVATDTITDDGVTFPASSDDAEQENDEIDALFDDDIDVGWEGDPEDFNILTCGLRFQDICVPQGATIDSAYILMFSHEAKTADDIANITIAAEDTGNAETFTEDALIDSRTLTSNQLRWIVDEEWGLWTPHRTPDIKDVVQEVINRNDWTTGNSIAFIMLGEDQGPSTVENAREFESFENIADPEDGGDGQNHPERVPQLIIHYSVKSAELEIPIVSTGVITDDGVTFEASSDDAEQENDEIDALYDDDIDAGWEGDPEDFNILTCGLRFQNLCIPKGAVIDSAFIEVFSHEAKTADDVANLTIAAEATDDAETFTEDALIDSRSLTSAQLRWIVDVPWGLWTPHRTPDVSAIVQEVVDRDGWEYGNDIAFIILGEDQGPSTVENAREFESFENIADPEDGGDGQNHPERIPRLRIYYSSPNTISSIQEVFAIQAEQLHVYPNPAAQTATVELENAAPSKIMMFNNAGQLVQQIDSDHGNTFTFDVSRYQKGVYFLNAVQNNKVYQQKLIIE
jgi:hypothetical protein